ncbi:efflux RND transporter periplasmic adaptor subunit [Rhodospirillum centenum]|uniref:HlyD family secretion protein n=1 Tax=Rhodospirillum centenum (strain ATCC 51521 / SW) TaxID=414684 RepID=B6IWB4_RHOCS|nr:efflux RND transporter periplasmic adaptor subunit [Rhodospirillum centenum]ACJ00588.1 HlyD family secretion protein [Rhodospirillum centenum SW]
MDSLDSFARREAYAQAAPVPADPVEFPAPKTRPRRDRAGAPGLFRRWRRGLTAVGILAVGVAGLVTFIATKPEPARETKPEREWAVDTVTVARGDHRPEVVALGTVLAGRTSELRPLVSGAVLSISPALRDGGVVKEGETLLSLDPVDHELILAQRRADLDEARARLDELRANLKAQQREAERAETLFQRGIVAAPRYEETQNAYAAEQARVRAQQAVIARLQAAVKAAETDLARTTLVAPFDGFVGDARAEAGMYLTPADRVAVISGAERLEAKVTVPTDTYGRLVASGESLIGREAKVVWSLGQNRLEFPARVVRVDDRINTAAGGVALFVQLDGTLTGQPIRPGAFVSVTIPDRLYADVIRLPAPALHDGGTVYVIEDGRLAARPVEVVAVKADAVYLSGGLQPGDRAVVTRFQEIGPGLKVTTRSAPAAEAQPAPKAPDAPKAEDAP